MPLFNRHSTVETAPPPPAKEIDPPRRHTSLFSRHRSISPARTATTTNTTHTTHSGNSVSPPRRGLLHRRDEDPSIIAAKERVANAEAAEREADKALAQARVAVRDAREHIKRLEKEAAEE